MRPKQRILLIESDEDRMSLRRYLLQTHGFHVISATSAAEARALFVAEGPGLVVCGWPLTWADAGQLLEQLRKLNRDVRSLLLAETCVEIPRGVYPDAILLKGQSSPAEIVERIKHLAQRKIGPRRKAPLAETAVAAERRIA